MTYETDWAIKTNVFDKNNNSTRPGYKKNVLKTTKTTAREKKKMKNIMTRLYYYAHNIRHFSLS